MDGTIFKEALDRPQQLYVYTVGLKVEWFVECRWSARNTQPGIAILVHICRLQKSVK